jgi:hypothetical protein
MNISDISEFSLESAISVLIMCLAVKLVRMRIYTHSGCCDGNIIIDTENVGVTKPVNECNSINELVSV